VVLRPKEELERRRGGVRAQGVRTLGRAAAILLTARAGGRGEVRRIRLCADPSNLPFSSQDTQEPGFEVEIARAIAEALGAELSVHWFPTAREILAFGQ